MEHEITILTGKVASDHIHVLVAYRLHVDVSMIVQWLKGISSRILLQEFAHLRRLFWGRHFWDRGYLAVSTGNLTDEMVQAYIAEQEGEPVHDDSRFVIDTPQKLPPSRR
jgi:putative transposase